MTWKWWIFLALLVSLVFGFYHFTIPQISQLKNYSPLALNQQTSSFTFDETNAYAPQVREFLDGNFLSGDALVWEYKSFPSPFKSNIVPVWIMGGLAKLTGSVSGGFILADFIWPPVVFLSLTYFIYQLTKKPYWAATGALATMFFFRYFDYLPYVPSIIKLIIDSYRIGSASAFVRSFHPQITLPFFIFFCLALWQNKKPWLLGISLGLLFYTYIYFWTFAISWLSLIMAWAWLTKKKPLAKRLLKALVIALILGIPYLWELRRFQQLPISQGFGSSYSFLPPLRVKGMVILAIMFCVSHLALKNKTEALFWKSMYLASFIMVIMVYLLKVTVDDPQGHWMNRIIYPLTAVLLLVLVLRRLKKDYQVIAISLSLLLLAYQAHSHWMYFNNSASVFQLEPQREEVFRWLNQNTPNDSVVATAGLIDNMYLPVYTHNNLFMPFSYLTLASPAEILERFLIVYKTAGIKEARIKDMLSLTQENQELKSKKRFNFDDCGGHYLYYRFYVGGDFYNCSVPLSQQSKILSDYQAIGTDLNIWRQKYKMDYWLWGPQEQQWAQINPETFTDWQLVFANQSYKLFKLPE